MPEAVLYLIPVVRACQMTSSFGLVVELPFHLAASKRTIVVFVFFSHINAFDYLVFIKKVSSAIHRNDYCHVRLKLTLRWTGDEFQT